VFRISDINRGMDPAIERALTQ